ncbi:hypothetical protein MPDQ_003722, partial [Monascus purpureus]
GVGIDTPDELAIIEGETISFVASLAFVQSGLPVRLASEPPATKRPILSTLGYYQQVKNFLEHGVSDEFPINDGQSTRKPWLFCGDPFVRQHMHDVLLDNQGNVVMDERGNLLLINDDRTMRTEYKRLQRTYRVTMYPHWSHDMKQYIWSRSYGASPLSGYCYANPAGGITWLGLGHTVAMQLCYDVDRVQNQPLGAIPPRPVLADTLGGRNIPDGAQFIADIVPAGYRFTHELFHLVWGNANSVPRQGEVYDVLEMLGFRPINVRKADGTVVQERISRDTTLINPPTYTAVA